MSSPARRFASLLLPLVVLACGRSSPPAARDAASAPATAIPPAHSAAAADWCAEHSLPESKCTFCHPELVAKFREAGDWCEEHDVPESVCVACGAELTPPATAGSTVRLASPTVESTIGIETSIASGGAGGGEAEVFGRLAFDPSRLARISARSEAGIVDVRVDVGDRVAAGAPLVVLESAAAGEASAELAAAEAAVRSAERELARQKQLAESGLAPRRELDEAERSVAEARGAAAAARAKLSASGGVGAGGRTVLTAPFAGTVASRTAEVGRMATPDEVLVEVADPARIRAELDVPEESARGLRRGATLRLVIAGESATATVSAIAPAVDPHTRTVKVFAAVPNRGGRLRAGTPVGAHLPVKVSGGAAIVPASAVQPVEGKSVVFRRTEPGRYEPVEVTVAARHGDAVEVAGLAAGAEVVTTGAFLLRTELLRDAIGAGCCAPGPR